MRWGGQGSDYNGARPWEGFHIAQKCTGDIGPTLLPSPDSILGLCDSQLHLHNEQKERRGQVGAGDSVREDMAVMTFAVLSTWNSGMEGQSC